jgi:hypothetical protein
MFSSITWELFLTAVVVAIGGYYGITTLLLYHQEITQWVKSRGQSPVEQMGATAVSEPSLSVMGNIQKGSTQELRSSVGTAEEINVAVTDEEPETVTSPEASKSSDDHLLIGSIADLLQEVKTISQLIAECKSDKAEGESLFITLLLRYPHLRSTTYRDAINLYIVDAARNQFSFDLSSSEVNTWWEEDRPSKNNLR